MDFNAIWNSYYPRLFVFVRPFFSSVQDREDAVQEIFTRIFSNLSRYNNRYSFGTWIYRIARNYCIDQYRRSNRTRDIQDQLQQDCLVHYQKQNAVFNPETKCLETELKQQIRNLIFTLEKTDQQLCYLYHYEDLNYREIAAALRMPVGTVKYRMHRIRNKIKKGWEAYHAGT